MKSEHIGSGFDDFLKREGLMNNNEAKEYSLLRELSKQTIIGTIQIPLNGGNKVKLSEILAGADAKMHRLEQQLLQLKAENEQLTQQNKQMREVLNDFNIFFSKVEFTDICQEDINEIVMIARRIPQTLKGGEG